MERILIGCMRFGNFSKEEMNGFIHKAAEAGAKTYDHADIYADGQSERIFGEAFASDESLKREDFYIQSKCGICKGYYDLSEKYILQSVGGILERLKTDYLDALLLHRPDALVEPEEVAAAFSKLEQQGKVRSFGVSNFNSLQIELLKKYVKQPLKYNQLQLSLTTAGMISQGMEVNMNTNGSLMHDASILDYCRLNNVTIQAWSPFQKPNWRGPFINDGEYGELNRVLYEIAQSKGKTPAQIAAAWILRHPAKMQIVSGTTNLGRLNEIFESKNIELTRQEWYKLYLSAGNILP